jgi:cell division protein FtsI (penicillin-binding protein 3)
VVVGVFIDEPKGEIYGGEVAAPAFKDIAEYALRMMDVQPAPAAVASAAPAAASPAPAPADPEAEPEPAPAVEWASLPEPPAGQVIVPSLAGLPARGAIRALEALELSPDLRGSGRVVAQTPAAGRAVARGTRVRMTLAPPG